jgi:transcriptional regulator with XRE-family HTH domain
MDMVQSFGARLRAEREQKQIALADVEKETKIKASLLEGLERDDLTWWPGGLFRRAYVRAYARAIGLDPERLVLEFLEQYPEPVEADPADTAAQAGGLRTSLNAMSALLRRGSRSESETRPATTISAPPNTAQERPVQPEPALQPTPSLQPEPSLQALANLCTTIGRISDRRGLRVVVGDAAQVLDAVGLVVWLWDSASAALRASIADGYSDAVIARLPLVTADADNAVAAAFRSRQPCLVTGSPGYTSAVAQPMMGPGGCVGVLAIEVQNGCEQQESLRAFAAILAAQLAAVVGPFQLAEAVA